MTEHAVVGVDISADHPPEEKPKPTLATILADMQRFDEAIVVDFDPKEVIGELKDKVDAIKAVIDRFEFQAKWCEQQAEPFIKAASVLGKNVKRLKEYVVFNMQQAKFAELPGNVYKAVLQNNDATLDITQRECTAADFMKYPNYVEQVRHYSWNNKAIKDALKSKRKDAGDEEREFKADEIPFAKLIIKQQVKFPINKPLGGKKGNNK